MSSMLERVATALSGLKLQDIRIWDFRGFSPLYDYVVLATGNTERQVAASVRHLFDAVPEIEVKKVEGAEDARWILIDLGDIIVNVMQKDERAYYQLEKLFIQREEVRIDGIDDRL
ncbi:MAG: ribosome silencing factor [Candidatus Izemoplasmatales bacterium]